MINWDDARFFLALARWAACGRPDSSSGGSGHRRATDHPARAAAGAKLFIRTPDTIAPAPGEALLPQAEAMAQAAWP